jgi:hypothetical protein
MNKIELFYTGRTIKAVRQLNTVTAFSYLLAEQNVLRF